MWNKWGVGWNKTGRAWEWTREGPEQLNTWLNLEDRSFKEGGYAWGWRTARGVNALQSPSGNHLKLELSSHRKPRVRAATPVVNLKARVVLALQEQGLAAHLAVCSLPSYRSKPAHLQSALLNFCGNRNPAQSLGKFLDHDASRYKRKI